MTPDEVLSIDDIRQSRRQMKLADKAVYADGKRLQQSAAENPMTSSNSVAFNIEHAFIELRGTPDR